MERRRQATTDMYADGADAMGGVGIDPEVDEAIVPGLDPMIARAVEILRTAGVETFESCDGGPGHSYPEPAVRFHGQRPEGFRALAIAVAEEGRSGLRVYALRRIWRLEDGEPTGPWWEIVFVRGARTQVHIS